MRVTWTGQASCCFTGVLRFILLQGSLSTKNKEASGKASPHGWKLRRTKMTRKEEHTACSRFHLTEALGLKQVQQRKQTSMILVLKQKANSGCSSPGRGKATVHFGAVCQLGEPARGLFRSLSIRALSSLLPGGSHELMRSPKTNHPVCFSEQQQDLLAGDEQVHTPTENEYFSQRWTSEP